MKIPKYLYHYTSIDTFDKILTNKTLRLNSLPFVDDKEEKKTADMGDFGRYCFISSWTDRKDENKDLWQRYGWNGKGLRIKMRTYPFVKHHINTSDGAGYNHYIKQEELYGEGYTIESHNKIEQDILVKVKYSNEYNKLYPKLIVLENKSNVIINTKDVGIYKNNSWGIQDEWRYKLMIYPIDRNSDISSVYSAIKNGKLLPKTDYYLKLDESALNNVEILLGRNTTQEDMDKVKEILERNNIKGIIKKSKIKC